jgi:hypothetical protein
MHQLKAWVRCLAPIYDEAVDGGGTRLLTAAFDPETGRFDRLNS